MSSVKWTKKLSVRMTFAFLVVALLPAASLGIYSQLEAEKKSTQQGQSPATQILSSHKLRMESLLRNTLNSLLVLTRSGSFDVYFARKNATPDDNGETPTGGHNLEQTLKNLLQSHPYLVYQLSFYEIKSRELTTVHNGAGGIRGTSPISKTFINFSMSMATGKFYSSDVFLNKVSGKTESPHRPLIRFSTPVIYNGIKAGLLIADVSLGELFGPLSELWVTDNEGLFLYHPDESLRWSATGDSGEAVGVSSIYPQLWPQISAETSGVLTEPDNNLSITYDRINLPGLNKHWYLLAENPNPSSNLDAVYLMLGMGFILALLVSAWLARRVLRPLSSLTNTVNLATSGQDARAELTTKDELNVLGEAIDNLLDERASTFANMTRENDSLNDSVIKLMEATAELSNKDLTIRVPVQEDITGAVADAMNQMVQETAKVLHQITKVAYDVREAANKVKTQGEKVTVYAAKERKIVEQNIANLKTSTENMREVADMAQSTTSVADQVSHSTEDALDTVNSAVNGMLEIREIISETEKRIKRLGERSQEINSVVEIVNRIAERTHVLALNASMQAAAAGDAGRGFAVVADEVQRLAESSRNSNAQIASLVRNIQVETSDTMATMNQTIDQVVAGSQLAEQAGKQMQTTKETTAELVSMVQAIAERLIAQAELANEVLKNAAGIQNSTQRTGVELVEQTAQTDNLVSFSKTLLDSVKVFKLPQETKRSA